MQDMDTKVIHVDDMVSHPAAVYIGRATPRRGLTGSPWANPYQIGQDGDRAVVIEKYRILMRARVRQDATARRHLLELAGKPLACWCRHEGEARTEANACHGDVLIDLIEEIDATGNGLG